MSPSAEAAAGLSIQRAAQVDLPLDDGQWRRFAAPALAELDAPELALRIVDEEEGQALNARWRGRNEATNVLSFPAVHPPGQPLRQLGDLVLCAPVVRREAAAQGKSVEAHCAHLLIHGILHLLGHDHILSEEAQRMEALEVSLLARLGFENPYETHPK